MPKYFGSYKMSSVNGIDVRISGTPVASEVMEEYNRITKVLTDLRSFVFGYECAVRNFAFLEKALESQQKLISSAHIVASDPIGFTFELVHTLNQHATNYIVSSRMFVEHAGGQLSRSFGKKSNKLQNFKEQVQRLYDSKFSYRLNFALRNYISHRDLPISRVTINARHDDNPDGRLVMRVAFMIDLNSILENLSRNQNDHFRQELSEMVDNMLLQKNTAEIDIVPILKEQAECDLILFRWLVEAERERIVECGHYMRTLMQFLQRNIGMESNEVPVIWESDESFKPGDKDIDATLQQQPIPIIELKRLVGLLRL